MTPESLASSTLNTQLLCEEASLLFSCVKAVYAQH